MKLNPLNLTKNEVKKYLELYAKRGQAEYECKLDPSKKTVNQLVESTLNLDTYRVDLGNRSDNLMLDEIIHPKLIESFGYLLWQGQIDRIGFEGDDYLIGKIIEKQKNSDKELVTVQAYSDDLHGLVDFQNYSGNYQPAIFSGDKIYLIKDIIEKRGETIEQIIRRSMFVDQKIKQLMSETKNS